LPLARFAKKNVKMILSRFINKHGRHRQFLFLIGQFLKIFSSETTWPNEPKQIKGQKGKLEAQ
jgi:hypothetical protein